MQPRIPIFFCFLYITKVSPHLTPYCLKDKNGVNRLIALKTMFAIHFKFRFHRYVLCDEMNKTRSTCIYFKEFLKQLHLLLYLHMFILATDQELWTRELIYCVMSCDHYLSLKEFLDQLNLLYI
jgi:hypothetical protein